MMLIERIEKALKSNNGKIPQELIEIEASKAKKTYFKTDNTVICVMRLESGHEIVGYAQVLDKNNFDENIGKRVAENKCKDKLWEVLGSIAIVVKEFEKKGE